MGQVVSHRELLARRGEWKRTGEGVVCAYGAFDLLHPGHVRLLEQAREFSDILVIAVRSDALVRADAQARRTAAGRPVTSAAERAEILAALSAVGFVAVVEEPLAYFLQGFRPDVFVCGDESRGDSALSGPRRADDTAAVLAEIGCELKRLPLEPGYSTTRLIERIFRSHA